MAYFSSTHDWQAFIQRSLPIPKYGGIRIGWYSNSCIFKTFTEVTPPLGSRAAMRVGSSPFRRTTSSRTSYRSRRLFILKSHRSFTPSLLLSNRDPLRWVRGWVVCGAGSQYLESVHAFHVGASCISLAPAFLQKSERTHSTAAFLQRRSAFLDSRAAEFRSKKTVPGGLTVV